MATPVADAQNLTGNAQIDGLVQGGIWSFGSGPRQLTYSLNINDTEISPGGGPIGGTWSGYPAMEDAVHRAFAEWEKVVNVDFVSLGIGGVYFESAADLAVTLTGDDLVTFFDAAGLGIFPDPNFGDVLRDAAAAENFFYPHPEGDLFFDNYLPAYEPANLGAGGLGFTYILHEIGHALGLKHPDDDGGNGRPTFAQLGITALDTPANTIMGRSAIFDDGDRLSGHVATPMPFDILAMQTLYGANTSYNTGNDIYAVDFDGAWRTLWDAGGLDTLDFSAIDPATPLTIDLRAGAITYLDGSSGDTAVAVAYNVVIENAIGTLAADTIHGNDADNRLDGGSGEDAQLQADTLIGHGGNDTYIVDSTLDAIVENPGEGTDQVMASASHTLSANVENLQLVGVGAISGTGNSQNNVLLGNAAANALRGAGGDDALNGGPDVDTALYLGSYVQYSFVNYLEILRVVDTQPDRDGVDQLIDVEQLHFDGDASTKAVTGLDQFTPLEYLASYAELYNLYGNDPEAGYQHYVNTGRFEGRTATFESMRYIASYPDLIQGLGPNTDAAVVHYISAGRHEGRVPFFNGRTYIASYSDLIATLGDDPDAGIEHFVRTGFDEGRTSTFDALAYIASYPDLIAGLGPNPNAGASHYINGGHIEGRVATFDAAQYLANYPDLQAAYGPNLGGATVHYIIAGFYEGRTDDPLPPS